MTALILTAALVFAPLSGYSAMTVHAEENTASANEAAIATVSGGDAAGGSAETTGKTQLATPTGLQWGEKGMAIWNVVEGAEGYYRLELYKDGAVCYESNWQLGSHRVSEGRILFDSFRGEFSESGAYQFRIRSNAFYDPDHYEDSEWSELSSVYNYVRPEAVVGSVACYWSDTKPGTICWQPVEGAGGYEVKLYQYQDSGDWRRSTRWWYGDTTETDFSGSIERYGAGRYRCTVRALSGDIEAMANGAEGEFSEYYDTTATADSISGIISGAMENATAGEALETIKTDVDKAALRTAMQTDDTVLGQIRDLESAYAAEQGITVDAPTVSEEAGAYVKADEISVVGAGLNAAAGQKVGLEVSVPAEKEYVPSQHYANSVQLDIRLKRGEESVHELDIPITITLPIPKGLDAKRLVILHYREDGSFETVNCRNSGDGMVTFTVSRFSTFAFAEQKDNSGEAGDDQSDNADVDTDDGSSNSTSEYVVSNIDWNAVGTDIDAAVKAGSAQNVDVMAGTRFTVPSSVTGRLAGKKVTLALQTGSGLAFSITGTSVKAAKELKMTISYGEGIPEAVRQQVTAEAAFSRMFAMEEKGNYPFRLNVHLSVGKENVGKQAYLYYYDEASGRMRLSGTFTVTESGQVMFGISRGDEYIVVVGQKTMSDGSYRVVTGDTLSGIAAKSGIGLQKLLSLNPQIKDKNKIYPDQIINIR